MLRDRQLLLVLLLAAAVIIPRSILISRAHSELIDDEHHLRRGLIFLYGRSMNLGSTDPLFGEALAALPMWVMGCDPAKPLNPATTADPALLKTNSQYPERSLAARTFRRHVLFGHAYRLETILLVIAIWKSVLFVPLVGLVFYWGRLLYGSPAGWAAAALLTFDPNFAANLHTACPDALGAEGIGFACWFSWRCAAAPSRGRIIAAAFFVAVAMSIKHTAVFVPIVAAAYAGGWWLRRRAAPERAAEMASLTVPARVPAGHSVEDHWAHGTAGVCLWLMVLLLSIWALDRFDISTIREHAVGYIRRPTISYFRGFYNFVDDMTVQPVPAGEYLASLLLARNTRMEGHWGYLFGELREHGWWYYFPVVASYKVPLGVLGLLALAVVSLVWRPARFEEWSVLLPAALLSFCIAWSGINYGFRHVLGPYLFLLILASRPMASLAALAGRARIWRPIIGVFSWGMLTEAAVHSASFHPDYLSYINFPRHDVWLSIVDTNLDFGQAIVEIRNWVDDGARVPGRKVWLRYRGDADAVSTQYWLGNRVTNLNYASPRPTNGLLLIDPTFVVGDYDPADLYGDLRNVEPVAQIGHGAVLVYDMDALVAHGFKWTKANKLRVPVDEGGL